MLIFFLSPSGVIPFFHKEKAFIVVMLLNSMIITTTDEIAGMKIKKVFGIVKGNTVRARHIGVDILAGLKQIIGGELRGYSDMLTSAREEATARMVEEAKKLGANAVVGVRFTSASIMANSAEILAFGTAVRV